MDIATLTRGITDEDWARAASAAGVSPQQFRTDYESALEAHPGGPQGVTVTAVDEAQSGDCLTKTFEIDLYKVITLKLKVKFCGGSSWSAELNPKLYVAGSEVWSTDYKLSPNDSHVCFSPSVGVAKVKLCIEIAGGRHCLKIAGEACYWAFGWSCEKFDKTLHCFG